MLLLCFVACQSALLVYLMVQLQAPPRTSQDPASDPEQLGSLRPPSGQPHSQLPRSQPPPSPLVSLLSPPPIAPARSEHVQPARPAQLRSQSTHSQPQPIRDAAAHTSRLKSTTQPQALEPVHISPSIEAKAAAAFREHIKKALRPARCDLVPVYIFKPTEWASGVGSQVCSWKLAA